jgi:hypothetical protein
LLCLDTQIPAPGGLNLARATDYSVEFAEFG